MRPTLAVRPEPASQGAALPVVVLADPSPQAARPIVLLAVVALRFGADTSGEIEVSAASPVCATA